MEWRIRKNSTGYVAERGVKIESQPNPCAIGYIMPAFIVYNMSVFDTEKQALNYIKNFNECEV